MWSKVLEDNPRIRINLLDSNTEEKHWPFLPLHDYRIYNLFSG